MKITISAHEEDQRFDRFLRKYFKPQAEIKLTDIFSRIRKRAIKINGRKRKQDYRLQNGDTIERDDTILTEKKAWQVTKTKKQKKADLDISQIKELLIYEDEHWLVRNKPADIVTHPWTGHLLDLSMHDYVHTYLKLTDQLPDSATFTPSFCFRLDKDTSGIIIAAKSYDALQLLNKLIRERKTHKQYLAIVAGSFPITETIIDSPLFKGFDAKTWKAKTFVNEEKWQKAYTSAICVETIAHPELWTLSLVDVTIKTGRMHQIRVHLASIGYPIIGDIMYGNAAINRIATKKAHISRQLLHSWKYWFFDRLSHKQLSFVSPIPSDFSTLFPHVWSELAS